MFLGAPNLLIPLPPVFWHGDCLMVNTQFFVRPKEELYMQTPEVLLDSMTGMAPQLQRRPQPLSFRERQIVNLLCEAKLNKEIAHALNLAEGTIKVYLGRIFQKVDVKNRTELALWAIRHPEHAS